MKKIRLKCKLCGKSIIIFKDKIGRNSKIINYSDEATFFLFNLKGFGGFWFCNKCWEDITKKNEIKIRQRKKRMD